MTRDDVIRLAREAGDDVEHTLSSDLDFLERFASIVAAAEREACAITAWSIGMDLHNKQFDSREVGAHCAAAIRARGDQCQDQ